MKNIEILKNYIENNNGILLTSDVVNMNIHKQYIKKLCEENYIEQVSRGVYVKIGKNVNDFFLLQQRYKKGIFSHNTALYFYHLTDRTPLKYDLTFESKTRLHDKSIESHYIKEEFFEIGLKTVSFEDGTSVRAYDIEKTIIDIIKDRNKIDTQILNVAIKEYMKRKDKNLINLAKYAKIFNVEKVLKQYMEVL
jgi:predicted transcriptional regulator of viral defense system